MQSTYQRGLFPDPSTTFPVFYLNVSPILTNTEEISDPLLPTNTKRSLRCITCWTLRILLTVMRKDFPSSSALCSLLTPGMSFAWPSHTLPRLAAISTKFFVEKLWLSWTLKHNYERYHQRRWLPSNWRQASCSVRLSYDRSYDVAGTSLNTVAGSDGAKGLITHALTTFDSLLVECYTNPWLFGWYFHDHRLTF